MVKVKVKVEQELELDWDSTREIVVGTLREDFDALSEEITRLRMKSELKQYEMEDLNDSTKHRDAIYGVMSYYMSSNELDMFMRNRSLL